MMSSAFAFLRLSTFLAVALGACVSATFAQPPAITAISSPRQVVARGQDLTLSVTATGATSYQWKRSGRPIAGATNATYAITNAQPGQAAGWYQVVVSNSSGSTNSAVVFVNVAPTASQVLAWGFNHGNAPTNLSPAVAIAAGNAETFCLKSDGSVAGWGDTAPPPPSGLSNVVAIAISSDYFANWMALRADGTVAAWGRNLWNEATVPDGLANVVAVAAGNSHSLALRADGTVVAWGDGSFGATAVPSDLTGVVGIAAGYGFSLALKADGTVVGWGKNDSGQSTPPAALGGVVAISAGWAQSFAITNDGSVTAWGNNDWGQTAVKPGLVNVMAVAAGWGHTLALKSDGTVVGWGETGNDQLNFPAGLNSVYSIGAGQSHSVVLRDSSGDLPPAIVTPPASASVFSGQDVAFSVTASAGTAMLNYQWRKGGVSISGATQASLVLPRVTTSDAGNYDVIVADNLGTVTSQSATLAVSATPVVSTNVTGRVVANAGGGLTLSASTPLANPVGFQWRRDGLIIHGATSASLVLAGLRWRDGGSYQVAVTNSSGSAVSAPIFLTVSTPTQLIGWPGLPQIPAGLGNLRAVAAGDNHFLALKTDGTVVAWGANNYGQTTVPGWLDNVVVVAAGSAFSMALKANGTVATWGAINYTPSGLANVSAIAAGDTEAFAVKIDGSVVGWNAAGLIAIPAGIDRLVALSSRNGFYLGLRDDASVVAWGRGNSGQTAVPAGLVASAVGAGAAHALALKPDGTVAAWGYNGSGQTVVPAGLNGVVAIHAGAYTNFAINAAGGVVTWGSSGIPAADVTEVLAIATGNSSALALRDASADTVPVITAQPVSHAVVAGQTATLTIGASGGRLSYQWRRNGEPQSGATSATLTLTNFQSSVAGTYDVVVTNYLGTVTSAGATLQVGVAPAMTSASSATFVTGVAGNFTFTATGTPAPTFGVTSGALPAWASLNPSTGVLTGTPSNTTGSPFVFTVSAANGVGTNATQSFTLTVSAPFGMPAVTTQPTSQMLVGGSTVSFVVAAAGSGTLSYRWYFTPAGSTIPQALNDLTGKLSGTHEASLLVSNAQPADAGDYVCVITNSVGSTPTAAAQLTIVDRLLKLVGSTAAPGSIVTVPVQLIAHGDENGVGFSVNFDAGKLTFVGATAGAQASDATLNTNSSQAGSGRVGIAMATPSGAVWAASTQEIVKLIFTVGSTVAEATVVPLTFGDVPVAREVSSVTAAVLPAGYQNGSLTALSGYEADMNGNGAVTITDWVKVGRIVAGLDPIPTGVDFQKADCAPRSSLGNGTLSITDWVQAGRYAAGLDPVTAAGGPSAP